MTTTQSPPVRTAEVPQPSEPVTPVVPSEPVTPIDPDPGSPAAPESPASVPAPVEPQTPIVPEPETPMTNPDPPPTDPDPVETGDTAAMAHSPQRDSGYGLYGHQLGGYAGVMAVFATLATGFGAWFRASGRELPERLEARDLALLTVASSRTARLLAKDRVTSPLRAPFTRLQGPAGPGEVEEEPRGRGLRGAVGDLLVCPYCLAMWTSAAFTAALLVAPRLTRWVASVFAIFFGADLLQVAYKRAEDRL